MAVREITIKYQGDCDTNQDCLGSLECGRDNCQEFHPEAANVYDCCVNGKLFIGFGFVKGSAVRHLVSYSF